MENFEEMLESYLDESIINEKINLDTDIQEENIVSKKTTTNNFLNTITISDFVKYYLGTEHDCKNLKHKGLKSFNNPYVVGISNEFAVKNPDCIRRQEILVVIDDYGNPGTYINPTLLKNLENMEGYKNILHILNSIRVDNLAEVDKLYNEYMKTINKIGELEKQYIDGCDLLNQLQKTSLLRQIRSYTKQASKKLIEFTNKQSEILEILISENTVISDGKKMLLRKEENKNEEHKRK